MSGRTYHEHVAGAPEFDVVEFDTPPSTEAHALRAALVRVTAERDFWRTRAQGLERDMHRALAASNSVTGANSR